jgi:RNA polymerase sigma factor (sigma-70 family)
MGSDYDNLLRPLREARERLAESLYEECRRAVAEVASKCGLTRDERIGLESQCCMKVLALAGTAADSKHLSRLVWRVAHSVVVDVIRKRQKSPDALNRAPIDLLKESPLSAKVREDGADMHVEEARAEVNAALTKQQQIFAELYWGQELTLKEIGEALGVSESRAFQLKKAVLSRARVVARRIQGRDNRKGVYCGKKTRAS